MATMASGNAQLALLRCLVDATGPSGAGDLLGGRCLTHRADNLLAPRPPASRRPAVAPGRELGEQLPRRPRPPRPATPSARRSAGRPPPWRRPRPGRRAAGAIALVNASGSSGGTASPAPARSTVRATSVPGSTLATSGPPGGQDRVELRRHARPGQAPLAAAPRGRRPAASTSGRRSLGCMSTKRTLSRPAARRSRSARADPPPLITNTTSGSSREARRPRRAPGRATGSSPTLPAYITTVLPLEAVLAPVAVLASGRAGSSRCR